MRPVIFLFLALSASTACAASFKCAKARTAQEKAICSDPKLSAADDQMAAAYRDLLHKAPPDALAIIRESQREWVRSMSDACPEKPSWRSAPTLTECLQAFESSHIEELPHMLSHMGGVTFIWHSITLTAPAETSSTDKTMPDGPGTLNASWPQAMSESAEWKAWNRAIEAAAIKMVSNDDQSGLTAWKDASFSDADIDVSAGLNYVSSEVVTATVGNSSYSHGAAHPSAESSELNWLLKEQRPLQAVDLFRADSSWAQALQTFCDRDLHKKLDTEQGESYEAFGAPGQMPKTLQGIVTNPENWHIDSAGITIIWQQYAVACYACTPDPTTIPWSDLKSLLRPGFKIPTDN